jgi:hypothetical protein
MFCSRFCSAALLSTAVSMVLAVAAAASVAAVTVVERTHSRPPMTSSPM